MGSGHFGFRRLPVQEAEALTNMAADDSTDLIQLALTEFDLCDPRVEVVNPVEHCNAKVVTKRATIFF